MPLYTFVCPKCDSIQDVLLSFSETKEPVFCDFCLQEYKEPVQMIRLIGGPPNVQYKAKGFYSTDYPKVERVRKRKQEWDDE